VSLAIWDHTATPATRQSEHTPALTQASEGWYSIYLPRKDGRLIWHRWLVIPRWFTRRRSPIQVLTGPCVEELR